MKRVAVVLIASFIATLALASYNPFSDGALASVKVMVVDDNGDAVEGAKVSLVFHVAPSDVVVAEGVTDKSGSFAAERNCTGEMRIWVRKNGYYEILNRNASENRVLDLRHVVRERKWSAGPVSVRVVLKKIRDPIRLSYRHVDFKHFPVTNETLRLDLETLDWCPPFGKGVHGDVYLVVDDWADPKVWKNFHTNVAISFPNCADGFYRAKKDALSAFPFAYHASTNVPYQKSIELRHVCTVKGIVESVKIPEDEYLICRVRTETNSVGQITHAKYVRITDINQVLGLTITTWFNPTDNDTNLEAAQDEVYRELPMLPPD